MDVHSQQKQLTNDLNMRVKTFRAGKKATAKSMGCHNGYHGIVASALDNVMSVQCQNPALGIKPILVENPKPT
eukprot:5592620-Amphidinium_carterae.1